MWTRCNRYPIECRPRDEHHLVHVGRQGCVGIAYLYAMRMFARQFEYGKTYELNWSGQYRFYPKTRCI